MRNYISKLSTGWYFQFHYSNKRSNCKNLWLVNHISAQPSNSLTCSFKIQHNPFDSFPFIFSPTQLPKHNENFKYYIYACNTSVKMLIKQTSWNKNNKIIFPKYLTIENEVFPRFKFTSSLKFLLTISITGFRFSNHSSEQKNCKCSINNTDN